MNNQIETNGRIQIGHPRITPLKGKRFSKSPFRLFPKDVMPFYSPYLQGGYREDILELDYVDLSEKSITGYLNVRECFMPGDGQFHLTVPLTFIWVAQLGIILGCVQNQLTKKEGEIYLREVRIKCRRPVNKTKGIKITLTTTKQSQVPGGIYYFGKIDVEGKAFEGVGSYLLPIKSKA